MTQARNFGRRLGEDGSRTELGGRWIVEVAIESGAWISEYGQAAILRWPDNSALILTNAGWDYLCPVCGGGESDCTHP